jgi:hypothetical protein
MSDLLKRPKITFLAAYNSCYCGFLLANVPDLGKCFYSYQHVLIIQEENKKSIKKSIKNKVMLYFCQTLALWQSRNFEAGALKYFFPSSACHKLSESL